MSWLDTPEMWNIYCEDYSHLRLQFCFLGAANPNRVLITSRFEIGFLRPWHFCVVRLILYVWEEDSSSNSKRGHSDLYAAVISESQIPEAHLFAVTLALCGKPFHDFSHLRLWTWCPWTGFVLNHGSVLKNNAGVKDDLEAVKWMAQKHKVVVIPGSGEIHSFATSLYIMSKWLVA